MYHYGVTGEIGVAIAVRPGIQICVPSPYHDLASLVFTLSSSQKTFFVVMRERALFDIVSFNWSIRADRIADRKEMRHVTSDSAVQSFCRDYRRR